MKQEKSKEQIREIKIEIYGIIQQIAKLETRLYILLGRLEREDLEDESYNIRQILKHIEKEV